jgi:hypothetical protein
MTDGHSAILGVKPQFWDQGQIFVTVRQLRVVDVGPPLWREDGSLLKLLLALAPGTTIFSSAQRPDRISGPPNLLPNGLYLRGKSGWSVKLTNQIQTTTEAKKLWSHTFTPPIRLRGVVLNQSITGQLYFLSSTWGPLSLVNTNEELLGRNGSGSGLGSREYGRRNPLR